ncbi:hypothetical protein NUW58_g9422 [Xylaria curta]|uniref:Uncharacterized protein n=1 Tax=Xylaria curta TaxID=42375 RepID=A0ACC1MXR0_9PEZI|nr:hypothetical protein NUW58_g9422 [Xylaria curta]
MSQLFTYSPLSEPGHIRLLLLQPAVAQDDSLVGSLQHISLNDHYGDLISPYTALSYVWGEPTEADTILLDGRPFGVTANLGAALRDLRDVDRTHRIWADALCINQNDIPERNQQVLLIGQIYSRANTTTIYLGALNPDAEIVIQEVTRRISIGVSEMPQNPAQIGILDAVKRGVLARPWFYRIWVLQELVLSREPWVQFGSKRIRWDDLCCLVASLESTDLKSMNDIRAGYWNDYLPFSDPGEAIDHHGERNLWRILKTRKSCGATDPRDVIFAHLGIISDKATIPEYIKIDYTLPTSEVFISAARYIRKCAGVEYLMRNLTDFRTNSLLPSWVPDWGRQISREMIEQGSDKSSSTLLTSSSRAEPFLVSAAAKILAVSSVLSSVSLCLEDLPPEPNYDYFIAEGGGRAATRWKELVDGLCDAGIERIAVEEAVLSCQNHTNNQTGLSVQHRISTAIYDHYRRIPLNSPQPGPRLALLNDGTVVAVPQEVLSGDFLICVVKLADDKSGFPMQRSWNRGMNRHRDEILAIVRPYASPIAKICEDHYVAKYEAAVSGHGGTSYYRGNTIMFLHGLFLSNFQTEGYDLYHQIESGKWTPELTGGWSTYNVRSGAEALPGQSKCIRILFLH